MALLQLSRLSRIVVGILLLSLLAACGSKDAAGPTGVYVAIGASDTVGVGAGDPETEGWVPRLHASMPRGTRLVNVGVSGARISGALDQQLPVALAAKPSVVTVWLAVNDLKGGVSLASYERDLDTLLGKLRGTGAVVAVGNIPDLSQLDVPEEALRAYGVSGRAALRAETARWNAAISRVARRHGAILVDIHARWKELKAHPEYIGADGFHPSSQGYARLATLWQEYLRAANLP